MPDDNQIVKIEKIDLGNLSKPATVLIEKISDAVGGLFKPFQIKRVAKAEAEAEVIKTQGQIEVNEVQRRALIRFVAEETKKQNNIETITQKAIPLLDDASKPEDVEDDWITNFFDKCRIISDNEMQSLWAKVLAGEANSPETYSKRTVNFLGTLDKPEAQLFTSLCGFCWIIIDPMPLVYDYEDAIYNDQGINFDELIHLADIGLINFGGRTKIFGREVSSKQITISYFGIPINLEFPKSNKYSLGVGSVMLTNIGRELFGVCGAKPVDGFYDYIIKMWAGQGKIVSSPYPRTLYGPEFHINLSKS